MPVMREAGEAFGASAFVTDITDATQVTECELRGILCRRHEILRLSGHLEEALHVMDLQPGRHSVHHPQRGGIGFSTASWIYVDGLAYKTVHVEAGIEVSASDILKQADSGAVFTQDSQPFDIAVPGEYRVRVKSGLFTHSCTLVIQDTLPPQAGGCAENDKKRQAYDQYLHTLSASCSLS